MNLICNNCVGARFYRVMGWQFTNPFMWSSIRPNDFVTLVNDFNKIDLKDVSFGLEKWYKNDYQTVVVTLSNGVKIHFIHYIQDDSANKIISKNGDSVSIRHKNILEFAREKWFIRLNRMNEDPIFLYSFNYCKPTQRIYVPTLKKLLTVRDAKLMIVIHDGVDIGDEPVSDNIKVVSCKSEVMDLSGTAVCSEIKDTVLSFI